jgi:hypothetical protein
MLAPEVSKEKDHLDKGRDAVTKYEIFPKMFQATSRAEDNSPH